MLFSFVSSSFCLSITDRMMLRSSSVRWLRSGISGPSPGSAASAGPAGPDIVSVGRWKRR